MTREELITKLRECVELDNRDPEVAHSDADEALMDYINDAEIATLYNSLTRWCA